MQTFAIKRLFDVAFSLILLVVTSPFMLLAGVLAFIDGHRNPLFLQERLGKDCKTFTIFKFRTMHASHALPAGEVLHVQESADYLTPIGRFMRKTSLDELPQLLNILKGDMAFIGPRPHAPAYAEHYANIEPSYYQRYAVRPGLAGLVQITALRNLTESPQHIRARVASDMQYIKHASITLDLAIFVYAALGVLKPIAPKMVGIFHAAAHQLIGGMPPLQAAYQLSAMASN